MMMVSSRLILATALALSTSAELAANVFFDPDAVKHSCVVESLGTTQLGYGSSITGRNA